MRLMIESETDEKGTVLFVALCTIMKGGMHLRVPPFVMGVSVSYSELPVLQRTVDCVAICRWLTC